jgi:hypothetical protein
MDSQKPTSRIPSEIKATVYQTSTRHHPALQFSHPLPYGAILHEGGVQFVVFSRSAMAMRLLLYDRVTDPEPTEVIQFNRDTDRWGDIWSIYVPGIGPGPLQSIQRTLACQRLSSVSFSCPALSARIFFSHQHRQQPALC